MPLFGRETEEERSGFIGKIWETVSEFFAEGFRKVWNGFSEILPETISEFLKKIAGGYKDLSETAFLLSLKWFEDQGLLDLDDMKTVYNFSRQVPILTPFLQIFVTFSMLMGVIKTKMGVLIGTFVQQQNAKHSPNPPGPGDILRGAFIAPEKTGEIRDRIKANGFSDDDIDLMFLSQYRLYTQDEAFRLFLRGDLSKSQLYERMREMGFTDKRTDELAKLYEVIPSIQDLIYMTGKEAFEADIIEHIGLDAEFPGGIMEWAKKLGLSEDWVKKYWYAHWDQPGIQQGYEMLHREDIDNRGNTIITMEELDMLFRIVEIPPFWRERLTKIAYMPYTRVDTRRMHKVGVLSDEELIWSYRNQGYDIEHAIKMAQFTVRYNMGAEKELSKGNILGAYRDKAIDKATAKELLVDLDYSPGLINFYLSMEDHNEEKDFQDDLIDNIRDKYQNRLIEKKDAIAQLNAAALPQKQISLLIDKWTIKVYKDRKLPSKTDLEKWLRLKIIDDDNYKWRMSQIGYPYDQINHYLEYIKKTKK